MNFTIENSIEPLNEDELLSKDWQLPMEDVTEPQPKDEIPIETAEIPIIPDALLENCNNIKNK